MKHKENLLSQIAYSSFLTGNYVFRQEKVEREIEDYIKRLPNHDQSESEIDSGAILRAIEGQHGLLVERAHGIYSFSHLTFHEYFATRYIVSNCDPNVANSPILEGLVERLTDRAWREIFLLTCEMLTASDNLLKLMKLRVNNLLSEDQDLQEFLKWVNDQSQSLLGLVGKAYNAAAVRACYLDFDILLDQDRVLGCLLDKKFTINFTCASFLARVKHCQVQETFQEISEIRDLRNSYDLEPAMAITFARSKAIQQLLEKGAESSHAKLVQQLRELYEELPASLWNGENDEQTLKWFRENGKDWGDRLRHVAVSHFSLGGSWSGKLTEKQKTLLEKFYHANLLLVACLRSDCCVEPEVRQSLEDTLLLPVF